MKAFGTVVLIASLCLCGYGDVAAQSGVKEDTKRAGEAAKEAGKSTGGAAKHAGRATAKAAKKAGKAVKKVFTGGA